MYTTARSMADCAIQCSLHSDECQAGIFEGTHKVCKLLERTLSEVKDAVASGTIYFEDFFSIPGKSIFNQLVYIILYYNVNLLCFYKYV